MFKKILLSWVFWLTVIGIMCATGGIWYSPLGILSAFFLISGAVIQGVENVKAQEHIQKLHAEATQQIEESRKALLLSLEETRVRTMQEIEQARKDAIAHIEQVRKEERFITQWATRLLVGIVWTFHWFGYDRYIKRWIRNQHKEPS